MNFHLQGKKALVTGSMQGTKAAIARTLTAEGTMLNVRISLAKRFNKQGVGVNVVSPGIFVTETIRQRIAETARKEGRRTNSPHIERHVLATELDNPTGRLACPQDVASTAAFLYSSLADYINGTNIRADGGSNVTINP